MSYQVLARKWRPRTFREMVGQEHVLRALINALDHDRLHHAYLFTGTRGVGKTTIARILAKCLNCEAGVSSEPCGQCAACIEIGEGRFVDLIEVDAASRTKVEDTRELLENVQYAPTRGRYKVYLIDEVHMLSGHSFNALLKTLEEPPPHVKFLLATTDPQKLPATILSRCLQFSLKNMTPERIVGHLSHVLEQEMVPFEEPALWHLGRAADGSMRDALSLTDQAIAFGSGRLMEADVQAMLGTIDYAAVFGLIEALTAGDAPRLMQEVARIAEHAIDYGGLLDELLAVLHRIALAQVVPDAVDNARGDRDRILTLAATMTAEDAQLFYQIGLLGRRDLPLAPDPRIGLEMALLRIIAFRPQGAPRPDGGERPPAATSAPTAVVTSASTAPAPAPDAPAAVADTASRISEPRAGGRASAAFKAAQAAEPVPPAPASELDEYEQLAAQAELARENAPAARPRPHLQAVPTPARGAPVAEPAPVTAVEPEPDPVAAPATASAQPAPAPAAAPVVRDEAQSEAQAAPMVLKAFDNQLWCERFAEFGLGGILGTIAAHCCFERREGRQLHFVLDEQHASFFDENHCRRLEEPLGRVLGEEVVVLITVGSPAAETPAQRRERLRLARLEAARQAIREDPNVRLLAERFGATVDESSIEPVEP